MFLVIFIRFTDLLKKKLLKQIKIFLRICFFSNTVRKTNFLSFSLPISEIVNFMSKNKSSLRIFPKCIKTTEKHSLAVCGSLSGEKLFWLIFISFYWFEQKKLFKQILNFLRICLFSNMVRKTNSLYISMLVSELDFFFNKKRSSL